MDGVTIATFDDPTLARLARSRLEAAGIACHLVDLEIVALSFISAAVPGVRLEVAAVDAERARALLDHGQ